MQNNGIRTGKRKYAVIIAIGIIFAILAGFTILQINHHNKLRMQMDQRIENTLIYINNDDYQNALAAAQDARGFALLLQSDESVELTDNYINTINAVINADAYYHNGDYQYALYAYLTATIYASKTDGIDTTYIDAMKMSAQWYINFFDIVNRADSLTDAGDFKAALPLYYEADSIALGIPYSEGRFEALKSAALMNVRIAIVNEENHRTVMLAGAKRHMSFGDSLLLREDYVSAVDEYRRALDIYTELGELSHINYASAMIDFTLLRQAEKEAQVTALQNDATDRDGASGENNNPADESSAQEEHQSSYQYNRSISFDLSSMIDSQDTAPASQIKMGTVDEKNEGWYNGCGWIATYNMLVRLDNAQHPADIVRYFEDSGGTVMDGVFGTYPRAIESYLIHLGYNVKYTAFPKAFLNIDNEIASAGSAILAYAHTSAAHYVMIEYRDSDGKYIVYNDSLAHAHSRSLNLSDLSSHGAVIDSVEVWLSKTPEILFAFSLITV